MNKTVTTVLITLVVVFGVIIAYDHLKSNDNVPVAGSNSIYNSSPDTDNKSSSNDDRSTGAELKTSSNSGNKAAADTNNGSTLPALQSGEDNNESSDFGSLSVQFNDQNKNYIAVLPFDNKGGNSGEWSTLIYKRKSSPDNDVIYISLPSDVQAGDKFTLDDGRSNPMAWGPPQFAFQYTDSKGIRYSLGDNNSFDSFTLVVDQWDGRNGYASGRFAGELRPYGGETVIFNGGSFKIKIRP